MRLPLVLLISALLLCRLQPLRAADVAYPLALASAQGGEIFIADRNQPAILRLQNDQLSIYFQASKQFRTPLNAVRCLAIDRNGKLLAGDSATRQVYRFNDEAKPEPVGKAGAMNLGPFGIPMSLAANSKNEIFLSDLEFHCIWQLPAEGGEPRQFAKVQAPIGICIDAEDHVWVVSRGDDQLRRIAPDGKSETIAAGRPFEFPHNVALDDEGRAYVVDGYAKAVWRVTRGQAAEKWFTHEKFQNPVDIKAVGDVMMVIDPRAKAIFKIDANAMGTVVELK